MNTLDMSLIGSEVDVSHCSTYPEEPDDTPTKDLHTPLSPPRAAESLFLGSGLPTQHISASALAEQLHINHRQKVTTPGSKGSHATNFSDFMTAIDDASFLSFRPSSNNNAPGFFSPLSSNRTIDSDNFDLYEDTMSTATTSSPTTPMTIEKVNAATNTYGTAKNVWAWGKKQIVIKPFLGIAEGVAGKVVQTATGASLDKVDRDVSGHLRGLDDSHLNPALSGLIKALLGAAEKTTSTLKPILEAILKPLGLLKNTAETPELTVSKPALTSNRR